MMILNRYNEDPKMCTFEIQKKIMSQYPFMKSPSQRIIVSIVRCRAYIQSVLLPFQKDASLYFYLLNALLYKAPVSHPPESDAFTVLPCFPVQVNRPSKVYHNKDMLDRVFQTHPCLRTIPV